MNVDSDVNILVQDALDKLRPFLRDQGAFIYSALNSYVANNPLCIYGLNPATDPVDPNLRCSILKFLEQRESVLDTQRWTVRGYLYHPGESPYQKRANATLGSLTQTNALITNLFFVSTSNAAALRALPQYSQLLEACWDIHEKILRFTRPYLIVVLGKPTLLQFCRKFHLDHVHHCDDGESKCRFCCKAVHGNWKCLSYRTEIFGLSTHIAYLPHLSWYAINAEHRRPVLNWLSDTFDEARSMRQKDDAKTC